MRRHPRQGRWHKPMEIGRGLSGQSFGIALVTLPIPSPVAASTGVGAFRCHVHENRAVAPAPGIFPEGSFVGVVGEVKIAEAMHLPVLHPAEAGEVAFGQVVCRAVIGAIFDAVIDAASVEFGMQGIVGVGFVGADRRALEHVDSGKFAHVVLVFALENEGQRFLRARLLFVSFLKHHEDAALVGFLVGGKATVDPVFLLVLRADMPVHVGTVHVDLTGQR